MSKWFCYTAGTILKNDAIYDTQVPRINFILYVKTKQGHRCLVLLRLQTTTMVKLALNEINMKLSTKQIEVIVNNTFREADVNNDGVIDYDEYKVYCKKNPRVLEPFRIDIASLVLDEQENRRGRRVSQAKMLRHWPTDTKKKNQMFRKIKKSVPGYMKREKIERVRSIHNAQEIMGLDDDKNDKHEEVQSIKEISKKKKKKKKKLRKKKITGSGSKSVDENDDNSNNNNKRMDSTSDSSDSLSDEPQSLRFALSADSAEREKMKKEKYSKRKKKKKRNKKMDKQKEKPKNVIVNVPDLTEATALGLNTSVPRTPPKSKEKPKIKQADLDMIERLLN
eukprot:58532_1